MSKTAGDDFKEETIASDGVSADLRDVDPPEDPSDLRARLRTVLGRHGISQKQLSEAIGYSRTTVSLWLGRRYERDDTELAARIEAWLAKTSPPPMRLDSYVETPTSEKIMSMIAYAQGYQDMVAIYGGPGVGKTTTIREFQRLMPERTWCATITPASAGLVSCLELVATAVGLGAVSGGARKISNAIRERVGEEPGGVLIIDEAQHLAMASIEELRSIHDATDVGLALVGNEMSYARLTGGARAMACAQIYSRIGARLQVLRPDFQDVIEIADAWGVTDKEAIRYLGRIGERPGGLRSVTKVLRMVTRSGREVTEKALKVACRNLGAEV